MALVSVAFGLLGAEKMPQERPFSVRARKNRFFSVLISFRVFVAELLSSRGLKRCREGRSGSAQLKKDVIKQFLSEQSTGKELRKALGKAVGHLSIRYR